MRHRKSGNRLGRPADHRKALLKNLATSLVLHGQVTTTTTKAKALKAFFEPMITRVRASSDMNAFRFASTQLTTESAQRKFLKLVKELKREGGWLQTTKVGLRDGDAAEMTRVELGQR